MLSTETFALATVCACGAALADITIGVSLPLTGPTSALGIPLKNAIAMWPTSIGGEKLDVIILDDIGYIQQGREEMEVLFTFLAERYERRSVMITSNLVFSQWDRIFKDPMTTAAAIDRVVHHSVILEMTGQSVRDEEAKKRNAVATGSPRPAGTDS